MAEWVLKSMEALSACIARPFVSGVFGQGYLTI